MSKFEQGVDAVTQKIEAEWDADTQAAIREIVADLPKEPGFEDSWAPPAEETPVEAQAEEAPPAPAPETKPEENPDRALLRLMDREAQVREREARAEAREREMEARLAELESRSGQVPDLQTVRRALAQDPARFVEHLGLDPAQVSRLILGAKLGDKAPPEMRQAAQLAAIRQELADELAAVKEQLARSQRETGVREWMTRGTEQYPALARFAAADPDAARAALTSEMSDGSPPEVAAKRLESRYSWLLKLPAPAPEPVKESKPTPVATPAGKTSKPEAPPPSQSKARTAPKPQNPRPYYVRDEDDDDPEVLAARREALEILRGNKPATT